MHGVYRAKHAFRQQGSICGAAPARSTPTSPNCPRGARRTADPPLEKCSSEPNVFDGPAADGMSASLTGVLPAATPPRRGGPRHDLVVPFERGDLFQVLSKEELPHWWAVHCLSSGKVGFVPSSHLEHLEPGELPCHAADLPQAQDGNCGLLYELRSRVAGAVLPTTMIPEPDVCTPGGELEKRNRRNMSGAPVAPPLPPFNAEGLILPRKPVNPCLESADHKNLHRELLFNHKIGKNVLNQKSELQRALEKHKELQVKKEIQQQKENSKSALERVIEERAKRLEMKPEEEVKSPNGAPEFLQVHAKLRARMDSK